MNERSVNASRMVAFGERTAVAVLDGMEPGTAIVLTVTVVKD